MFNHNRILVKDPYKAIDGSDVNPIMGNNGIRDAFFGNDDNNGWLNSEIFLRGDTNKIVMHETRTSVKHIDIVISRTKDYDIITSIGASCFSHVNKAPLREFMMIFERSPLDDSENLVSVYQEAITLIYILSQSHLNDKHFDFGHDFSTPMDSLSFGGKEFKYFGFIQNPYADEVLKHFNLGEVIINDETTSINIEFLHIVPLYEEESNYYAKANVHSAEEAKRVLTSLLTPVLTKLEFDVNRLSFVNIDKEG